MEFRLFTVGGPAWVGLHRRTVLLMSREALRALEEEVAAVVAHEFGHDLL
jgi:Zn-dependent protease with chaperone function